MRARLVKLAKRVLAVLVIVSVTLLAFRAWQSQQGAPLQPWHTHLPPELTANELARTDWGGYVAQEKAVFEDVRTHVTEVLEPDVRVPSNRYFSGSPLYPARFASDWNRSYVLDPAGAPTGAVVLLHGLTDSPYSLRHIASRYRENGFVAVAIRLPGHGTVPAGLTDVRWEAWSEAARLAVREARRRAGPAVPLHIVGFSNGGALAVKYAVDAIGDPKLPRAGPLDPVLADDRGDESRALCRGVRAARPPALICQGGLARRRAGIQPVQVQLVPDQRRAAIVAPVARAAAPACRLRAAGTTGAACARAHVPVGGGLHGQHARHRRWLVFATAGERQRARAVRSQSQRELRPADAPDSGYAARKTAAAGAAGVSDDDRGQCQPGSTAVVARITQAGATAETTTDLGLSYPVDVFSLSHLALPFPMDDSLYGTHPRPGEDYGVHLGAMAARGERGLLVVSMDSLVRMTSNPFFPYVLERIDEVAGRRSRGK